MIDRRPCGGGKLLKKKGAKAESRAGRFFSPFVRAISRESSLFTFVTTNVNLPLFDVKIDGSSRPNVILDDFLSPPFVIATFVTDGIELCENVRGGIKRSIQRSFRLQMLNEKGKKRRERNAIRRDKAEK